MTPHKKLRQTPAEYAEQLRMPAVSEITAIYQQVRFGDRILGDGEIARIDLLLREIKKRPRRALFNYSGFQSSGQVILAF